LVGLPPPSEDESFDLAERATEYVTPRVRSTFGGVVEAIRALHTGGYRLHTASGERSIELDGYLTGMGVRSCFGRLYGPDLINTFKEGPEYYARIFADAGVPPVQALVVDDNAQAVAWAQQAGARSLLVAGQTETSDGGPATIGGLAELPAILRHLG
ncbi:MAG: HAD hydrolase-like protein, partial [Chloroflexota bacterium]